MKGKLKKGKEAITVQCHLEESRVSPKTENFEKSVLDISWKILSFILYLYPHTVNINMQ